MDIGMLWFDNDPKTDLQSKVMRAAAYYAVKYGQAADLCFVHPSMINSEKADAGEVSVRTHASVLPNHFWIGVRQLNTSAA